MSRYCRKPIWNSVMYTWNKNICRLPFTNYETKYVFQRRLKPNIMWLYCYGNFWKVAYVVLVGNELLIIMKDEINSWFVSLIFINNPTPILGLRPFPISYTLKVRLNHKNYKQYNDYWRNELMPLHDNQNKSSYILRLPTKLLYTITKKKTAYIFYYKEIIKK